MAKIKIISNPYKKEIRYQRWIEDDSSWKNIEHEDNPDTRLHSRDFTEGFFPFNARKIVDVLCLEYGTSDSKLEIVFQGSADEFAELREVCTDTAFEGRVELNKDELYLENARDILPEVKKLFQEMNPLIAQSADNELIRHNVERFSDASGDMVPICVLGNYSSGKSTFINALTGCEILPSGSEPVTAKVYKISRSMYKDRARVSCLHYDNEVEILFTDTDTSVMKGAPEDTLVQKIRSELGDDGVLTINERLRKTLNIINSVEDERIEDEEISDLIEVEVPFAKGVLAESQHPFVIFDTPGSNSASNEKHLEVLKQAMADMTNGLPVFLCTSDSLDSTDNENLYKIIREMNELDSRFTMIVVNKADNAGVNRKNADEAEERKRILNQAVPHNLYSGGLFYVSSILGLGAKNDGEFADDAYLDVFDAQEPRYTDPANRHYKTLYKFDIMPEQLKIRADRTAAEQNDLLYVNSGLFTIEKEIETFAGKYSAYNKCYQSQLFLNKVIQLTQDEIQLEKEEQEGARESIKEKLESDKLALLNRLDETKEKCVAEGNEKYKNRMETFLVESKGIFTKEDLRLKEKELTEQQRYCMNYDRKKADRKNAASSMWTNLKDGVSNAAKNFDTDTIRYIVSDLKADAGETFDRFRDERETRRQVDEEVSGRLLEYVNQQYSNSLVRLQDSLEGGSKDYWNDKTEELRKLMIEIVAGTDSDVLTDERREELERIIIEFKELDLVDVMRPDKMDPEYFVKQLKIMHTIIWKSNHLELNRVVREYNQSIQSCMEQWHDEVVSSHIEAAHSWINSLMDEIQENIVEYNPELSKHARRIKNISDKIDALNKRRKRLEEYTQQLEVMMDWK